MALLVSACGTSAPTETLDSASDSTIRIDAADLGSDLQQAFDEWAEAAEGGGVALVRTAAGDIHAIASGIDADTELPLTVGDGLRVGSISKVFTATMVMQLVDEGRVDLDEPVGSYLPDIAVGHDVSVRQLLGHRSGLPNYTDTEGFQVVVIDNPDRQPAPSDLLTLVEGNVDFDPGERFAYSNTNYIIAGLVIEALDEQSLAESLSARIVEPLGLENTQFADGSGSGVAAGYTALVPGSSSASRNYTSIAYGSWAAGGLITTIGELEVFLDALFFGELVSPEARDEMVGDVEQGADYGLGIHAGPDFGVGHGGSIIGFNSIAEVDLDTGEMVLVVVNNDLRNPDVATGVLVDVLRGSS